MWWYCWWYWWWYQWWYQWCEAGGTGGGNGGGIAGGTVVVLLLVVSVVLVLLVVLELALKHPPPPKEGLLGVPPQHPPRWSPPRPSCLRSRRRCVAARWCLVAHRLETVLHIHKQSSQSFAVSPSPQHRTMSLYMGARGGTQGETRWCRSCVVWCWCWCWCGVGVGVGVVPVLCGVGVGVGVVLCGVVVALCGVGCGLMLLLLLVRLFRLPLPPPLLHSCNVNELPIAARNHFGSRSFSSPTCCHISIVVKWENDERLTCSETEQLQHTQTRKKWAGWEDPQRSAPCRSRCSSRRLWQSRRAASAPLLLKTASKQGAAKLPATAASTQTRRRSLLSA